MLCILKRTTPLDGSFEYPQQFFSLVERDKKCFIHVRIQRGTGGQDPTPPPGKLQKYRVPLNELLLQNIPGKVIPDCSQQFTSPNIDLK